MRYVSFLVLYGFRLFDVFYFLFEVSSVLLSFFGVCLSCIEGHFRFRLVLADCTMHARSMVLSAFSSR